MQRGIAVFRAGQAHRAVDRDIDQAEQEGKDAAVGRQDIGQHAGQRADRGDDEQRAAILRIAQLESQHQHRHNGHPDQNEAVEPFVEFIRFVHG